MIDYKKALFLKYGQRKSTREIAAILKCGKTTIAEFLSRFEACDNFFHALRHVTGICCHIHLLRMLRMRGSGHCFTNLNSTPIIASPTEIY